MAVLDGAHTKIRICGLLSKQSATPAERVVVLPVPAGPQITERKEDAAIHRTASFCLQFNNKESGIHSSWPHCLGERGSNSLSPNRISVIFLRTCLISEDISTPLSQGALDALKCSMLACKYLKVRSLPALKRPRAQLPPDLRYLFCLQG